MFWEVSVREERWWVAKGYCRWRELTLDEVMEGCLWMVSNTVYWHVRLVESLDEGKLYLPVLCPKPF